MSLKIAYIRDIFPLNSNTFIMEEVTSLIRAGHDVRIIADICGFRGLHERAREESLFDHVSYTRPRLNSVDRAARFAHIIASLVLRPGRYFANLYPGRTFKDLALSALRAGRGEGAASLVDHALQHGNLSIALDQHAKSTIPFVPDVIHCPFLFEWEALQIARLLREYPGTPYTVSLRALDLHNISRFDSEQGLRFRTLAGASRLITISRFNRDFLATAAHLRALDPALRDPDNVPIVHSAIDTRFFAPDPSIAKVPGLVSCVARLVPMKGLHYLVLACSLLVERGVDVRCVILGDGPMRSALPALIASCGLEERVTLHTIATQHEVRALLARSQVFALPCVVTHDGDRDILPNSLKEAMAMELPVVTSDISGISELVEHDISGVLVPSGEVRALADQLARLLADAALRERLGHHARRAVVESFDTVGESRKLANILADVAIRA